MLQLLQNAAASDTGRRPTGPPVPVNSDCLVDWVAQCCAAAVDVGTPVPSTASESWAAVAAACATKQRLVWSAAQAATLFHAASLDVGRTLEHASCRRLGPDVRRARDRAVETKAVALHLLRSLATVADRLVGGGAAGTEHCPSSVGGWLTDCACCG